MVIQLSVKELNHLKSFLKELNDPSVVNEFNNIFAIDRNGNAVGIKGRKNPIDDNQILVTVPQEISIKLLMILTSNGNDLGKMIKGDVSVTKIPKWISFASKIGSDIKKAFTCK